MTHRYQVIWTPVAQKDLESTINFMAKDGSQTALRIFQNIRAKASLLHRYPKRGGLVPELSYIADFSFREIVIPPWRLIYRIRENRVEILAFFDGRRDLSEVLFQRLTRVDRR